MAPRGLKSCVKFELQELYMLVTIFITVTGTSGDLCPSYLVLYSKHIPKHTVLEICNSH